MSVVRRRNCLSALGLAGERGSMTAFYALTVIPVVATLTIAAVDMSGWSALRDKTQQEAQRIAQLAVKVLPNTELAANIVQQEIAKTPYLSPVAAGLSVERESLRVALSANYNAVFDTFLAVGGFDEVTFTAEAAAEVQINPMDYVLIFADGDSLRPKLNPGLNPADAVLDEPWGSATEWPSSNYFSCASAAPVSGGAPAVDWWARWNDETFQRWATQSCFNPVFSNIKLAAISLVDTISASSTNRLAVIATPGEASDRGFAILRHINGQGPTSGSGELATGVGGFFNRMKSLESTWQPYQEVQTYLGDEMCVFLSHPDTAFSFRYDLPTTQLAYQRAQNNESQCRSAIDFPPCGSVHSPYQRLSQCFLESQLSLRESIYWRAAKLPIGSFAAKPDIVRAVRQAASELLIAHSQESLAHELQVRGQLAYKPLKKVIVISDHLPDPADTTFVNLLNSFQQSKIQLLLVGLKHEQLALAQVTEFELRFGQLQELAQLSTASQVEGSGAFQTLRMFRVENAQDLPQLASVLGVLGREYSIRCTSERADGCNGI